jgi:DNA-binding GntR family transcriptional regulator
MKKAFVQGFMPDICTPVLRVSSRWKSTLKTFGGLQQSLKMHEAIIDAIELRNESAAAEAAEMLLGATYRRNFAAIDKTACD